VSSCFEHCRVDDAADKRAIIGAHDKAQINRQTPGPFKNRKSGGKSATSFSFFRLAWKLGLVLLLLLVGWTIYLDVQVTSRFEGHRWEIPSRVFARP